MQKSKNTLYSWIVTLLFAVLIPATGAQAQAGIAARQAEIAKLKDKIVAIDKRRRADVAQLEESRQRLQEAKAELQTAKVEFSADGSELNARRVKNAEFTEVLKQREYDRLQERLQNYDTATRQTATRLVAVEKQVADVKAGRVAAAAGPDELAKTQQELEAAKARNEAAKQEVTRLRAIMAEANGKPTATPAAPEAAAAAEPVAAAQPVVEKKPEPTKQPEPEKTTYLSKEQRYAIDQYERIAKMFRDKGLDENENGPAKEMLIDAMVDFWIESKRTMQFGYLGHGQYIVETKLRNGDATFIVDQQRWRYTIPEQDDNTTYMFLLDTTVKPLQLNFFRKDLLLVD